MVQLPISVVIPTYRRPKLLSKCLQALCKQELQAGLFEVIVVSDGYDEETEKAVRAFPAGPVSILYKCLPVKGGPAAARNMGWQSAKGRLIAFTDDDTMPATTWLASYVKAYQGEELAAFTGSIQVPLSASPTDYERNTAGLETADFVTANCCCTKAALQAVGGFDERFSMAWREDSDLEFKLLIQDIPVVKIPDALVVHPVRKAPWGVSIKEQKKGMFNALLYKKFPNLYRRKIQLHPPWKYYIMVLSFPLFIWGLIMHYYGAAAAGGAIWFLLLVQFIFQRLKNTSRQGAHIGEMIVTSAVIPFLSVYWQLYGAIKYRVLFL